MKKPILLAVAVFITAMTSGRAADAKENWEKNCLKCHGADGKGDTKLGKKAGVKDLTDPKVQAGFTDEKAFKGHQGRRQRRRQSKDDASGKANRRRD